MSLFERAADRWDARSRSRKAARTRRARHAQLMADIAYVLTEAHAVLSIIPNTVVRTPSGPTTITDIKGHVARLLHRLTSSRRKAKPVTTFELAACLETFLREDGPCSAETRENHPGAIAAARLLDRWNGIRTNVALCSEPPSPATTKETS